MRADRPIKAWSAPSAIGTAGLGVGGQAGAEMTDFLVVLNSRSVSQPSCCQKRSLNNILTGCREYIGLSIHCVLKIYHRDRSCPQAP